MKQPGAAWLGAGLLALALLHVWVWRPTEPHHNNDESRHVMTGVFVRDALSDAAWQDPEGYARRYYLQYPALGLLVWPPLFYAVEGLVMSVLGTSFVAAQLTVAGFAILALVYVDRWARLTWGNDRLAAAAAILFGLSPLGFRYSRHVMLEIPTLAFCFAAMFYFERYLLLTRRGDALRTGFLSAAAALTRFDAVFLLPYFGLRLLTQRRLRELTRPAVWAGILLGLALTGPYYLFTWQQYGSSIAQAAQQGTMPDSRPFDPWRNLPFYPSRLPFQAGVALTVGTMIGLWRLRTIPRGGRASLCLIAAVYVTFTPLAELEDRHVIYWIPAVATWAAAAAESLADRWSGWGYLVLFLGAAIPRTWNVPSQVHGYADAAQKVLASSLEARVVFFDGALSGNFIYQMRHHDPDRSVMVLRGDKLIYGVRSDPAGGYVEWTPRPDQVLDLLHRYDPDWIIIEHPQALFPNLPGARLLRQTLRDHPDRYEHVRHDDVPIRGTHPAFQGVVLEFYRPLTRNPNRERLKEMSMLSLGRPLRMPED